MADPRYFKTAGPFGLGRLLFALGLEPADAGIDAGASALSAARFTGVAPLSEAQPDQISFLHNPKYRAALRETEAGAVLVTEAEANAVPEGVTALIVDDPYRAFAQVAALFHPRPPRPAETVIHSTAVVAETAAIGAGVTIGAFVEIGDGAEIGAGSVIEAHSVIGTGVVLGEDCDVETHCSVSHALIGKGVHLKPGVRVGQGGFGWALSGSDGQHLPVPQLGRVIIGDRVEIGANTAVDRGAGPDTRIEDGTIIDNLCQIAHNVQIGPGCAIAGHTAIGGSAQLEAGVLVGGGCLIFGHLTVGGGSQIHAGSHVTKSCPAGSTLRGVPARDYRLYLREEATLRRMARKRAPEPPQD